MKKLALLLVPFLFLTLGGCASGKYKSQKYNPAQQRQQMAQQDPNACLDDRGREVDCEAYPEDAMPQGYHHVYMPHPVYYHAPVYHGGHGYVSGISGLPARAYRSSRVVSQPRFSSVRPSRVYVSRPSRSFWGFRSSSFRSSGRSFSRGRR